MTHGMILKAVQEHMIGGKIAKDMNNLYVLCDRIYQKRNEVAGGAPPSDGEALLDGELAVEEDIDFTVNDFISKLVNLEKQTASELALSGTSGVEEQKGQENEEDLMNKDISSLKSVEEIKDIIKKRSIQLTDEFVNMITTQVFSPIILASMDITLFSDQNNERYGIDKQVDKEITDLTLEEEAPEEEALEEQAPEEEEPDDDDDTNYETDDDNIDKITDEEIKATNDQNEKLIEEQKKINETVNAESTSAELAIIEPSQISTLEDLDIYIDSKTELERKMNEDKYNDLPVESDSNRINTMTRVISQYDDLFKQTTLFEDCIQKLEYLDGIYSGLSNNINYDDNEIEAENGETTALTLKEDEKISQGETESYVSIIKNCLENIIMSNKQGPREENEYNKPDSKILFESILNSENILKKKLLKPVIECIERVNEKERDNESYNIYKINDIFKLFKEAKTRLNVGEYLNFYPDSIEELDQKPSNELKDLLKTMKRKLLTIVHTDHSNLNQQACKDEPFKTYCESLFSKLLKININSLFTDDESNGPAEEASSGPAEEASNGPAEETGMGGGAKRKDRLYINNPDINKIILSKQTQFIMNWLDLLNLEGKTEMTGLQDFNFAQALYLNPAKYDELKEIMNLKPSAQIKASITETASQYSNIVTLLQSKKKKAYRDLIKPFYVYSQKRQEYINLGYCIPSHFILNAQLLILGSKINSYKKGNFSIIAFDKIINSISSSSANSKISALQILGPLANYPDLRCNDSWQKSKNIDDQLQEMMNIIITYDGFEDPTNFTEKEKIPLESGYNKQIFCDQSGKRFFKEVNIPSIGKKEFYGERFDFPSTDGKKFIVNNASTFSKEVTFGGLNKNQITDKIFCPIASILDAMKNCSINSALKNKSSILNPMNFEISDSGNRINYNVSYITPKENSCQKLTYDEKKDGFIILSINLTKYIKNDSEPNSSPISINKCIPFTGNQLSATLAYKSIISKFHKAFSKISSLNTPTNTVTRSVNAQLQIPKLEPLINFIDSVMGNIFQNTVVKSIGDYAQEGVVLSKFSALEELEQKNNLTPTIEDSQDEFKKNSLSGDSFRVGIANDRPSAYRMIYTALFATKNSKNHGAIVGYYGPEKSNKNFMVYPKIPHIYLEKSNSPTNDRLTAPDGRRNLESSYQAFLTNLVNSETSNTLTSTYRTPIEVGGGNKKTKKLKKKKSKKKNKLRKKKKSRKKRKSKKRKKRKINSKNN